MTISEIFQTPFGTILAFSTKIPEHVVGKYIVSDKGTKHLIKGVPVESDIDIFVEKTLSFKVGDRVTIEA